MATPKVSIGMPVYNGERLLRRALDALVSQDFADFELIVSDNASTDSTADICATYARFDSRIRYTRQATNIGPAANFRYVLEQANAPLYMWAAHDDVWQPQFLSANYDVLATQNDVTLSISEVEFVNEDGHIINFVTPGTTPLLKDPRQNLIDYLDDPAGNSRFYGLHRTEVIRQCYPQERAMWAHDWLVMARTLKFGKHFQVPGCLFQRSPDGASSDAERLIRKYHKSWFIQKMPMLPFTWAILTDPLVPRSWGVWRPLWKWNQIYMKDRYLRVRHHLHLWRDDMRRSVRRLRGKAA